MRMPRNSDIGLAPVETGHGCILGRRSSRVMPGHHRTLAQLDVLVSEARELCARAQGARLADERRAALDPGAVIHYAFQTVLVRQVRDWMHRAEKTVRTVKGSGDTICGERANELRRLVDTANVAMLKRSDSRE